MQSTDEINNKGVNQTTAGEVPGTPDLPENKKPELKPNRHMKRRAFALDKREKAAQKTITNRRLGNFRILQDQTEKLRKLGDPNADMFFKIALNRLFKKDFKKPSEFRDKMAAILRNLSDEGREFKYKEELAAIAEANLAKKQAGAVQPPPEEKASEG